MNQALNWCDKQLGRMAGLLAFLASLAVAGLMVITVVAVIWRYLLNDPIFGIEDLSIVTLTLVAAGAVALGARQGAHVSVNVIRYFAGRSITRVTDLVMRVLAIGITGLATYALITKACGLERGCITENLSIEHTPFYYVLAAAFAVITLTYLLHLLIGLKTWRGDDPNEAHD